MIHQAHRIILASSSPQRSRLLESLGIPFEIIPSAVDEEAFEERDPALRARVLASLKAKDVHSRHAPAWVIGSDTLVVSADGALLEKPKDEIEARHMLSQLSGKTALVHSGLSLWTPTMTEHSGLETSAVHFRPLTEQDIDWWIEEGQWKGRSGGFQVEGIGERLIHGIEGDRESVIGLPVQLLRKFLVEAKAPFRLLV